MRSENWYAHPAYLPVKSECSHFTFRQEREPSRRNQVKSSADLAPLARNALLPIEKKLKGIYATNKEKEKQQKEISTSNLVQMLIQEATDDGNLVGDIFSQCAQTLIGLAGKNVPWLGFLALSEHREFGTDQNYILNINRTSHTCMTTIASCIIHHEPANSFCSLSNSFSRSMRVLRHLSCCSMTLFLAVSSLSASSFSMTAVNSGNPPLLASSDPGFAV